jgi:hypothetical protein
MGSNTVVSVGVLPVLVMQALQLRDTNVTSNTAVTSGGGLLLGASAMSPEASGLPGVSKSRCICGMFCAHNCEGSAVGVAASACSFG